MRSFAVLLLLSLLLPASAAAEEDGARAFTPCRACHSLDPAERGLPGPNLSGLIGRAVGGDAAFDYSPVLRKANATKACAGTRSAWILPRRSRRDVSGVVDVDARHRGCRRAAGAGAVSRADPQLALTVDGHACCVHVSASQQDDHDGQEIIAEIIAARPRRGMAGQPGKGAARPVPNPQADTNYLVRFTAPEFTSICPVTGQPDFAHLVIDYVPGQWLLESKSLKLYRRQLPQSRRLPRGLHGHDRQADRRLRSSRNGCASAATGIRAAASRSTCSGRPANCPRACGSPTRASRPIAGGASSALLVDPP